MGSRASASTNRERMRLGCIQRFYAQGLGVCGDLAEGVHATLTSRSKSGGWKAVCLLGGWAEAGGLPDLTEYLFLSDTDPPGAYSTAPPSVACRPPCGGPGGGFGDPPRLRARQRATRFLTACLRQQWSWFGYSGANSAPHSGRRQIRVSMRPTVTGLRYTCQEEFCSPLCKSRPTPSLKSLKTRGHSPACCLIWYGRNLAEKFFGAGPQEANCKNQNTKNLGGKGQEAKGQLGGAPKTRASLRTAKQQKSCR